MGYAYAEGWAHYTEEMMWDAGLGEGAADVHVGQLLEALLRNVRFVCAIGMHTEHMAVADCEKLFIEQAYTDAGSARQQAARGTFDPAYLNYTLGKLMIRKLRDDWTATRGDAPAGRAFMMPSCPSAGRRYRWCASRCSEAAPAGFSRWRLSHRLQAGSRRPGSALCR